MISEKELVLLGMLSEKPMYGYEIEKQINETSMREWTEIAFSSIYYLLKQLESKSLVTSVVKLNEKGQGRKIYTITTEGKEAAKSKVLEIISSYEKIIWRIDLGMAYLDLLSKEEILNGLNKYIESINNLINGYSALQDYLLSQNCSFNRLELAKRPLFILDAEKKWVEILINMIKETKLK